MGLLLLDYDERQKVIDRFMKDPRRVDYFLMDVMDDMRLHLPHLDATPYLDGHTVVIPGAPEEFCEEWSEYARQYFENPDFEEISDWYECFYK